MISPDQTPFVIAVLAAVAVLGVLVAGFYSRIEGGGQRQKRLAAISSSGATGARTTRPEDARRRDIERTLRELEERQDAVKRTRPSLLIRMRQAGLDWSATTYTVACGLVGTGAFLLALFASGAKGLPAIGFGLAGGLVGPHFYVTFLRNRRFGRFSREFPNAIDVIVRGVRSGLPVVDCIRMISVESDEPVRSEFREIVDDQTLGLPLDQAVHRLPTRIPLPEAKFFAIVLSMQSRTGGSLSDALGGLSKVLRDRQKMRAKIRAMSTEGTTSAAIIGSLPIAVLLLMQLSSPAYIEPIFATFTGNVILAGCVVWMALGSLIMWKMIRFDF